ncbi:BCCT family transporter [Saccharopolyspora soli]|uniref:BCCT family transporter n=1 Tax=Saccharopolyspora soli TaxID=2926618 RepID=UPI001F5A11D3|nr:BCCT family transporter [Saccharopolyspora soli]
MGSTRARSETSRLSGIDVPVATIAAGLTVAFLLAGLLASDVMRVGGLHIYAFIADWFGWVYVLSTGAFVFFILYLAIGRFGHIKLGAPEDKPEYSTFSWIAMMFALGVGIGLIFYGAAEPTILYADPPPSGPAPRTAESATVAMQYSVFHWGLHPWAFFGVAGLAMAYATHNKGRTTLVTDTLRPIIGDRADGAWGRGINTWVIVTTLVGNSVTLGLGTLQIVAGLGFLTGTDLSETDWLLIVVISVLSVGFLLSAVSGVGKGIKRLADFNVVLALALLVFLLVLGPVRFILDLLSEAMGGYLFNFIPMSFETGAFDSGTWMQDWTVFFWAWGISWAPYVGSFLAKISRGRTIREYVMGVLVAPTIASIVWFAVLGGAALDLQLTGERDIAAAAEASPQAALFEVLETYPLTTVTSAAVVVLAAVFFISGADAGALVLGTFSSRGNPDPKKWIVVTWGVLIGLVALVLLMVGGLDALQWGAIVVASPFVLMLLAMCVGFVFDLRSDTKAAVTARPVAE